MIKRNNKQRLFEMMGKIDKSFNINEINQINQKIDDYKNRYGYLVPWVLDKSDISVIDRFINKYINDKELLKKQYQNKHEYENELSNLWDNHLKDVTAALWKKAQA